MYLIGSAVNANRIALAIIIVINSVIAAFYYLRPVGAMFLKDPDEFTKRFMTNATSVTRSIIALLLSLSIISILLVEPLLNIIEYS